MPRPQSGRERHSLSQGSFRPRLSPPKPQGRFNQTRSTAHVDSGCRPRYAGPDG